MTLRLVKGSTALLWIVGFFAFFVLISRSVSAPDGFAVLALTVLPPLLLWFWWNDPEPTMSESIQEARNPVRRAPARRD
jgi:hypothetical protein